MSLPIREVVRRGVWAGFWAGLLVWFGRSAVIPATIRAGRVLQWRSSRPAYALIVWEFGSGARPISVIFDLYRDAALLGSVTTDDEATEAEIPLLVSDSSGAYTLVATATYRLFGRAFTREYRFSE